jgi:hypothetical protein
MTDDAAQAPAPLPAPAPARQISRAAALVLGALLDVVIIVIVALIAPHDPFPRSPIPTVVGPQAGDHWHVALGVDDCGLWTPNWLTPVSPSTGVPIRAGTDRYAGLHSHGDGLIHLEPASSDEMGQRATLGQYFTFAGFELDATSISFADGVNESNGNPCDGKRGVLRWAVNGKEHRGDPAAYKLRDGDVVELVFATAGTAMPLPSDVPSYRALREIRGFANT